MIGLDGAAILSTWEGGLSQSLGRRAIALMELSGVAVADFTQTAASRRDRELLRLRRRLFGDRIDAVATCRACGEDLDITLDVDEVLSALMHEAPIDASVEYDGHVFVCRIPTADDLAAIEGAATVERGVEMLLERCLTSEGGSVMPPFVSAMVDALDVALERVDPGANLVFRTICSTCAASIDITFDIPSFLWKEVGDLAGDLLWEIHTLATAYGWNENTILALGAVRRRFYIDSVTG